MPVHRTFSLSHLVNNDEHYNNNDIIADMSLKNGLRLRIGIIILIAIE